MDLSDGIEISKGISEEHVREILNECPNLKSLYISGINLQPTYLLEIEQNYGVTLFLDRSSKMAIKRLKTQETFSSASAFEIQY